MSDQVTLEVEPYYMDAPQPPRERRWSWRLLAPGGPDADVSGSGFYSEGGARSAAVAEADQRGWRVDGADHGDDAMWFEVGGRRVVRPWLRGEWAAGDVLAAAGWDPREWTLGLFFPAHGMLWFEDQRWGVWPASYRMVVEPPQRPGARLPARRESMSASCRPVWWGETLGCKYCGRALDHLPHPEAGEYCSPENDRCLMHTPGGKTRSVLAIPYHRAAPEPAPV